MAKVFYKFSELPLEIRNMIWREAALVPRICELPIGHLEERFEQPSALLLVCKEAERISKPIYQDSPIELPNGRTVYFNYDRDILLMVQLHHRGEQGSTPGQICEHIFFNLDHAPERFFFDLSRIRHLAISMETGFLPVRGEGAFRRLRRARKAEISIYLAEWPSTFLEHMHENLSEELQSFTLIFDATRQTEKRPRYCSYSPARNFSVLDASSSRALFDIHEEIEATLYNPHDVNPLDGTPSVLQACNCWKESELKICLGTVVRDRLGAKRTARATSRSLSISRENWGEAIPYSCEECFELTSAASKAQRYLTRAYAKISRLCQNPVKHFKRQRQPLVTLQQ